MLRCARIWGFSGSPGAAPELKTYGKTRCSGCSHNCFLSVWGCSGWRPRRFRDASESSVGASWGSPGDHLGFPGVPWSSRGRHGGSPRGARDALGSLGSVHPPTFFSGEVFLGASELLRNSWFLYTFPFGSVGPLSFLKRSLLFWVPGGPQDAGGRPEAGLALSWRSVRVLRTLSVCSLGSSGSAVSALFSF